jgi:tRNA dimethylallyltransferase
MGINLIVILGATASGKTGLAVKLANILGSEIISADSRQIYRGMNIGTGKELGAYCLQGIKIPYHLIDIVDPREEFSVFDFQQRFFQCFNEISQRGVLPILVGGTGLYLEAVLKAYRMQAVPENPVLRNELAQAPMDHLAQRYLAIRPQVHNRSDLLERSRLVRAIEIAEHTRQHDWKSDVPHIDALVVGIRWDRAVLRARITERLRQRLSEGMIEEVQTLHDAGVSWERLHYFGLEYRYIGLYLQGKLDDQALFRTLNTRIHQFAKRQETWFRRMERSGTIIHWLDAADDDVRIRLIREKISSA